MFECPSMSCALGGAAAHLIEGGALGLRRCRAQAGASGRPAVAPLGDVDVAAPDEPHDIP